MSTEMPQSVQELIDEYIQDERLRGKAKRSINTYESNLDYIFSYLDCTPEELDKEDLKRLLHHLQNEKEGHSGKGLSDQTINVYFSALNSLYEFLTFEGYLGRNPIPAFRRRYLQNINPSDGEERQLISVSEMAGLIMSIMKTRDKAIILTFAKTGIRRKELVQIDVDDVNWEKQSIKLKPTAKRSNRTVYFDRECAQVLRRWMNIRDKSNPDTDALFTNREDNRLQEGGIYLVVTKYAERMDLHNPDAESLEEKFTPHCCRHWFTTHLRRSGMRREYIKELRGDSHQDTMDDYNHIDREALRESYITHIPQLNI